MSKKQPRNTKGKIISAAWKLFYEQGYDDTTIDESCGIRLHQKAPFIIILKEKMLCSDLFPFCLTKNIWNWKHSFPALRHAMNS